MTTLIIILWLFIHSVSAHAAQLTATVDRAELPMGEPLTLTLSLIDSNTRLRAEGISPNVDLSVLAREFDVGVPRTNNRYTLDQGRGRSTSTLTVELFAKHPGTLAVPAFRIDGLNTRPIRITVRATPSGTAPEVYSRAGVTKARVWAGEQVVVYLDFYRRVALTSASMGEDITTEPKPAELLDARKLPQTQREEIAQGQRYQVQRLAWALFPRDAGRITVHLPDIWIVTQSGRRVRLPQQQLSIDVRALPPSVSGNIIIGKPAVTQSTLDNLPGLNTLTSWNITLTAPVNPNAMPASLPPLHVPAGLKLFLDRAARRVEDTAEGTMTRADYSIAVMPLASGDYQLEDVKIPYFDPERGAMDRVVLPGQRFKVAGNSKTSAPAAASATHKEPPQPHNKVLTTSPWPWISGLLALGWIATVMLWRRQQPPSAPTTQPPAPVPAPPRHPLQARLLEAFDSPSLEQGLMRWEQEHGVDATLRDTVRAVQRLCYGAVKDGDEKQLSAAVDASIAHLRAASRKRKAPTADDPWLPESFQGRL